MGDTRNLAAFEDAVTIAYARITELETALREARGWLEHWGGDAGSLGTVLQELDAVLERDWEQ